MTYIDGHLVNVNSLLDAELGDIDIKCSVQYANNLGLTHDRSIALSQVGNQQAQEEVSRLLLSELSRVLLTIRWGQRGATRLRCEDLHVALLSNLCDCITVHRELRRLTRSSDLQNGIELTVNQDVRVTTDRRGKVRVDRHVQRIMTVLRNVKHTGAEVLGTLGSLLQQDLQDATGAGVSDSVEGLHDGTRGRDVDVISETLGTFAKGSLPKAVSHHALMKRLGILTKRRSRGLSCLRSRACSGK